MSDGLALANVGLHVEDVDRSLAFYRDLLGLEVRFDYGWQSDPRLLAITDTADATGIRIVNLVSAGSETSITLVELRGIERTAVSAGFQDPGTMHLAFRVDSLDSLYERITAAGYRALAPPSVVSGGAPGKAKIVFLVDPDGFAVELVEPVE
jgi:lactoylglutathione lyase